jgi:hypothetical protein
LADEQLHHHVVTWKDSLVVLYVDGINSITVLQSVKNYSLNNRLFIQNVPNNITTISVTMYNITGSIVYQNNDFQNGAYLNLKQGVYVVKVESQEDNFVQKVVIK